MHKYLTAEGERRVRTVDDDDADGRRSITLVQPLASYAAFSLLDVTIKTGRTHQIRVHLQGEGHPIVGDDKYGDFELNKALSRGAAVAGCRPGTRFDRMFLHARRLRFTHPGSGELVECEAPMPPECSAFLESLLP